MNMGRSPSWTFLLPFALLVGCDGAKPTTYQDKQGLRFTPPPGWVLRATADATPAQATHRRHDLPMPPLDGKAGERLLVRYDRLTAGHHAWLRVSVANMPSSVALKAALERRAPGAGWKPISAVETLELGGLPGARIAFAGSWNKQDYGCETVAVRRGDNLHFFTASFPTADDTAREQVRQALDSVSWQD